MSDLSRNSQSCTLKLDKAIMLRGLARAASRFSSQAKRIGGRSMLLAFAALAFIHTPANSSESKAWLNHPMNLKLYAINLIDDWDQALCWCVYKGDFFKFASLQMDAIAAEMVVGEALHIPYGDLSDERFKSGADVGLNIEVKHTAWNDGHLIVAPRDRSSDIAVLVTGSCPEYRIAGWIPVAIAKQPRFKSTKDSSYWVGQLHLRPIENFRRSSYAETSLPNMQA